MQINREGERERERDRERKSRCQGWQLNVESAPKIALGQMLYKVMS